MTEIVEHEIQPGQSLGDVIERLVEEHGGGFSELRIGATVIGISEQQMRPCGGCSFCCQTLGVVALKKYPRQTCKHLEQHRCKIYENRPTACQTFNCVWKKGNWSEEWRPDKIGCVVEIYEAPEEPGHLYAVMNIDRKTADAAAINAMLTLLCQDFPEVRQIIDDKQILVVRHGQARIGKMLKRERGQYEEARYVLADAPL
jgi:hypothetical protein